MIRCSAMLCAVLLAAGSVEAAATGATPNHPPAKPAIMRPSQKPKQSFNDLVRSLVAAGEVRPLREVLEVTRKTVPGEIVGIKLGHQKTRWVYRVRVLPKEGRRTDLSIDGKTLKILERK